MHGGRNDVFDLPRSMERLEEALRGERTKLRESIRWEEIVPLMWRKGIRGPGRMKQEMVQEQRRASRGLDDGEKTTRME